MIVTDVKFRKLFVTEPLKAVCSVTVDGCLAIHDVKIIRAGGKTIIVMPSRKRSDGTFTDIVHPINAETRASFEKAILDAYSLAEQ